MCQIDRDPFARQTMFRETVFTRETCAFCGNVKRTPKGRTYLYRYYVENDGIRTRPEPVKGLFCGIDCMRSYQ